MNPAEFIIHKRSGLAHSDIEIREFIRAFTAGDVADYQMAAWMMSVFFSGMTRDETRSLVIAMRDSGQVMDLSGLDSMKVDKHSTGGVGDKTSIILAPLLASLDVCVPMISGRGLGHTGGTLDKLEAIPGFDVNLTPDQFLKNLKAVGTAMIGQTKNIAPADRSMYAIRDVTGTVESLPLICGSILSKKLAAGLDALVLDIKTGNGAFMKTYEDSTELGRWLVDLADDLGTETLAWVTDMNQPLGNAVGNWLEVSECIDVLKGSGPADVRELSLALGASMFRLANPGTGWQEARSACSAQLDNGHAFDKFCDMVDHQSGDTPVVRDPESYPRADQQWEIVAPSTGWVCEIDTFSIGMAGVDLKAGRTKTTDTIDPRTGCRLHKKIGQPVAAGESVCTVFAAKTADKSTITRRLEKAFHIGPDAVVAPPLLKAVIDRDGLTATNPFVA